MQGCDGIGPSRRFRPFSSSHMKTPTEQLAAWLNTAYAMEKSLERVLVNHARDAKELPEIHARLEQHLAETREHARRVEECLEILGTKVSMAKIAMGSVVGLVEGASTEIFRDELVKNVLSDYASEHFEIACYHSLVVAAEELGQDGIAELCRANLREEEAMASWLEEAIPSVTRLGLQEQPATR